MRSTWKGLLSFALVNLPIKLYIATAAKEMKFKTLYGDCHTPLMYKKWCPKCKKELQLAGELIGRIDDGKFEPQKYKDKYIGSSR